MSRRARDPRLAALCTVCCALLTCVLAAPTASAAAPGPGAAAAPTATTRSTLAARACGHASLGDATCLAEVLVSAKTGRPIHPRVRPLPTPAPGAYSKDHLSDASAVAAARAASFVPEPALGSPQWFQQAYDTSYLSATRGRGDTIAVVDAYDDSEAAADLNRFRTDFGLPACTAASGCFRQLNQSGQPAPLPASSTSWQVETTLDLDAASTLCPNCHLILVEANSDQIPDLLAADGAAAAAGADQVSDSWDAVFPAGPFSFSLSLPGVSVLAAAGDNGTVPSNAEAFPAALATVTAVGGTTLRPSSRPGSPRGFKETPWSFSGAGCDVYVPKPAYQPSGRCTGRVYNDISAAADPNWGLSIYDRGAGGWLTVGGTSLATPLVAGFEAITAAPDTSPAWAYSDSRRLNDPARQHASACAHRLSLLCAAGGGYYGPTGAGSISGAVVTGPPQVAGPALSNGYRQTETESTSRHTAKLYVGVYPNGLSTHYDVQYARTKGHHLRSRTVKVAGATDCVASTVTLSGLRAGTTYHYRVVAINAKGASYGYSFTFRTREARRVHASQPGR